MGPFSVIFHVVSWSISGTLFEGLPERLLGSFWEARHVFGTVPVQRIVGATFLRKACVRVDFTFKMEPDWGPFS